jgi:hypothetical protein
MVACLFLSVETLLRLRGFRLLRVIERKDREERALVFKKP